MNIMEFFITHFISPVSKLSIGIFKNNTSNFGFFVKHVFSTNRQIKKHTHTQGVNLCSKTRKHESCQIINQTPKKNPIYFVSKHFSVDFHSNH